jgi:hypothetical protein
MEPGPLERRPGSQRGPGSQMSPCHREASVRPAARPCSEPGVTRGPQGPRSVTPGVRTSGSLLPLLLGASRQD